MARLHSPSIGDYEMNGKNQTALAILRRKQVEKRVGLSRSTIYAKIAAGEFPAPIALGARAVGWLESDIITWIESCIATSHALQEDNHE